MNLNDEKLLEVKDLEISFFQGKGTQAFEAVKSLNFNIKKSYCLGLVGESGSGKSVSSLSIIGLLDAKNSQIKASSFSIQLNGESIDLSSLQEKAWANLRGRHIAMVFQEPMSSLNPVMSCGKQITEALKHHFNLDSKSAKTKTLELFQEVQLPDPERAFNSYPYELSGGQKQRVMIAMALSCDPELLIADESTTALDVTVQKSVLKLLKNLMLKRKMGMIFITHDLAVVSEIATEIAVMRKGELVEYGEIKAVLANPKHPYTQGLLACRPDINKRRRRLPTVQDFENTKNPDELLNHEKYALVKPEELQARELNLSNAENILEVQDLSIEFNSSGKVVRAVDKVSFQLRRGETLGLVGESGCGKSTLSRALLGLIPLHSGKILFEDKEISGLNRHDFLPFRKKMQLIFQDPMSSLNPGMDVRSIITEPMTVHGIGDSAKDRNERAAQLLKDVGMDESSLNRYPHEFSGGQRQRIVIARALAVEPEFIICDESVAALDVSIQAQVLNLLFDLKEKFNLSYIFITHDFAVVNHVSDRIMVMNQGRIEEIGWNEQLVHHPQSDYSKKLISSIPRIM